MEQKVREFLERNHGAAMITLKTDGTPHVVRVGIALVEGKLWSSGTKERRRTAHLRRDPRCTLFLWEGYAYLGLETRVTILEGLDVPDQSLRLFKTMQGIGPGDHRKLKWFGRELADDAFRERMVSEGRLIYEFDVQRAYGL